MVFKPVLAHASWVFDIADFSEIGENHRDSSPGSSGECRTMSRDPLVDPLTKATDRDCLSACRLLSFIVLNF